MCVRSCSDFQTCDIDRRTFLLPLNIREEDINNFQAKVNPVTNKITMLYKKTSKTGQSKTKFVYCHDTDW